MLARKTIKVIEKFDNKEDSIKNSIKLAFNSIVKEVIRSKVIEQGMYNYKDISKK